MRSVIYGEILRKNVHCAFLVPESTADVLLAEYYMFDTETDKLPIFRKMEERISMRFSENV